MTSSTALSTYTTSMNEAIETTGSGMGDTMDATDAPVSTDDTTDIMNEPISTDYDGFVEDDVNEWLYAGIGILLGSLITLLVIAIIYWQCNQRKNNNNKAFAGEEIDENQDLGDYHKITQEMTDSENPTEQSRHTTFKVEAKQIANSVLETVDEISEPADLDGGKTNNGYEHADDVENGEHRYSISDINLVVTGLDKYESVTTKEDEAADMTLTVENFISTHNEAVSEASDGSLTIPTEGPQMEFPGEQTETDRIVIKTDMEIELDFPPPMEDDTIRTDLYDIMSLPIPDDSVWESSSETNMDKKHGNGNSSDTDVENPPRLSVTNGAVLKDVMDEIISPAGPIEHDSPLSSGVANEMERSENTESESSSLVLETDHASLSREDDQTKSDDISTKMIATEFENLKSDPDTTKEGDETLYTMIKRQLSAQSLGSVIDLTQNSQDDSTPLP